LHKFVILLHEIVIPVYTNLTTPLLMLHKSVYFASVPNKSYIYYWMLQWNFFGICHPVDGSSRFFGMLEHIYQTTLHSYTTSMVTHETRNQMTMKSQACLWPIYVSQLQG